VNENGEFWNIISKYSIFNVEFSNLFAVLVLVLWVGFGEKKRSKELNLDVRNISTSSHAEQPWSYSPSK